MPVPKDAESCHPLYCVKLWRMGTSNCLPVHAAVMDAIGARPGDLVMVRIHPPYVTLRVAKLERIIPIDQFGPEQLPPSSPGRNDNATTPNDSPCVPSTTTRTTPRVDE